jgi:hypothetical protein
MPDAVPAQQYGAAADPAVSAEATDFHAASKAAVPQDPGTPAVTEAPEEPEPDDGPGAGGTGTGPSEAGAHAAPSAADAPETGASEADGPDEDDDGPRPLGLHVEPTGYAPVDGELRRLEDADHLAVSGHLEVYEDVHRGLREALAGLDRQTPGGPPQPGPPQPGPRQPGPSRPGTGAHAGPHPGTPPGPARSQGPTPGPTPGHAPGRPVPGPHHPRS